MHQRLLHFINPLCLALIALLVVSLPFELRTPLLQLGSLSITNIEGVMYLALAAWVVRVILTRQITYTPVHGAVILMALALMLSALFAPTNQAAAWKFTLRSLGGMALCFAVTDVVRNPQQMRLVLIVLVAAALLSALAALAEAWWPASRAFLAAFKTRTFNVGGFIRAGGTFEYPNTAAMFWEAALPLGIVLVAHVGRGAAMLRPCAAALVAIVLVQAIILSASRAALGGVALALVVLMELAWRVLPALRASVFAGALAAALVVGANLIGNPLLALRLRTETNDAWFRAEINANTSPITLRTGEAMTATVTVRNTSIVAWQATSTQPVRLSYHWMDAATNQTVILNGVRTDLPEDLPPHGEVILLARVIAPQTPGAYVLQWDVLQEHVSWFSTYGNPTVDVPVTVISSTTSITPAPPAPPIIRGVRNEPTRGDLWQAAFQLWSQHPLFGIGPDNFRHLYGPVLNLKFFDPNIHTNNWYIETLVNSGVIGAASLVVFVFMLARHAFRPVRRRSEIRTVRDSPAPPDRSAWLHASCYAALLTFFAHGLLDYFFEFTPTYGLFWVLVGLVNCRGTYVGASRDAPLFESRI
jgi:hypothetical protein